MKNKLTAKLIIIGILCVVFSFVFSMIDGLVVERKHNYEDVVEEIQRDYVMPQTLFSPIIKVQINKDCSQLIDKVQENKDAWQDALNQCQAVKYHYITAQNLVWRNKVQVDNTKLKRGIYHAIIYSDDLIIYGIFDLKNKIKLAANETIDWSTAQLMFKISDPRGIAANPKITLAKNNLELLAKYNNNWGDSMFYATNVASFANGLLPFKLTASIAGTKSLRFVPFGSNGKISVDTDWAHPKFFGDALPNSRAVTKSTSQAQWNNDYISNQNLQELFNSNTFKNNSYKQHAIEFIEPVDIYSLADRAVKYAILFIVVSFACFFLFEVLNNLRIHPIQYILIGGAQAVFYLLLLSFSEQISFACSYLIASAACIGLISYYVFFVLKSWRRTISLTTILTIMYATIYLLLHTQDLTLVLGSTLVFALIATLMVLTRKIDWYKIAETTSNSQKTKIKLDI